ncbi:MAG: hypothetical protein VW551_04310 [Euryarchaeota archaeon]|jgi:hypothetical protein
MEALAALIFAVSLNGLWDARDWEPPVPAHSTSADWYSAELECTETGFDYPGIFVSELDAMIEIAERNLCIEQKLTQIASDRQKTTEDVMKINLDIQKLIEERERINKAIKKLTVLQKTV